MPLPHLQVPDNGSYPELDKLSYPLSLTAFVFKCSEFMATDPEVPGSIPGATRFPEKLWVWNGVHSASSVQLRSYLKEQVAAPVYKSENTAVGIRHADHVAPSIRKSWH
jgi:hypothetical protein